MRRRRDGARLANASNVPHSDQSKSSDRLTRCQRWRRVPHATPWRIEVPAPIQAKAGLELSVARSAEASDRQVSQRRIHLGDGPGGRRSRGYLIACERWIAGNDAPARSGRYWAMRIKPSAILTPSVAVRPVGVGSMRAPCRTMLPPSLIASMSAITKAYAATGWSGSAVRSVQRRRGRRCAGSRCRRRGAPSASCAVRRSTGCA